MEKLYVLYKVGVNERKICESKDFDLMKERYETTQKCFPYWKLEIRVKYVQY